VNCLERRQAPPTPGAGEGKFKAPTLREVDTITANATIKGIATSCYSRMRASEFNEANLLSVVIGSVVCSNTTGASHEYFDQTGYDRIVRACQPGSSGVRLPTKALLHAWLVKLVQILLVARCQVGVVS
jgi:hypothetical protein